MHVPSPQPSFDRLFGNEPTRRNLARLIRKLFRHLERFLKSNYLVRSVCIGWTFPLFRLLTHP